MPQWHSCHDLLAGYTEYKQQRQKFHEVMEMTKDFKVLWSRHHESNVPHCHTGEVSSEGPVPVDPHMLVFRDGHDLTNTVL